MSDPDERPLLCGSGRVLMLGTVVLITSAAAVLAVGAQDARLLRLGLVAALWAALLAAFAAARMRREISSGAHPADELRMAYQLELEREVAARREHTLTMEREVRELRERVGQAERGEIAALRTELAAMRVSLEKLTSGEPLVERVALRAESARLLPVATYSHKFDDIPSAAAALGATAQAACSSTAAGSPVRARAAVGSTGGIVLGSQDLPSQLGERFRVARAPVDSAPDSAPTPRDATELPFGPGCQFESGTHSRPLVEPVISGDRPWNHAVLSAPAWEPAPVRNGKHGTSSQESSISHNNGSHGNGSHSNGSHSNGSHSNGGGIRRAAQDESVVGPQRSVNDLLAAHGGGSVPRRRRSREDGPCG